MPPIEFAPTNSDPSQIVIVTDNPVNRVVLTGTLARLGLKSRFINFRDPCSEGAQPRAVIIDCTGNAAGCSDVLRKFDEQERPKVLMITEAGELRDLPADYFLDKPMTSDKLEAAINRLLAP